MAQTSVMVQIQKLPEEFSFHYLQTLLSKPRRRAQPFTM